MKKIIFALSCLIVHASLLPATDQEKVADWLDDINQQVVNLRSLQGVMPTITEDNIAYYEYIIKQKLYTIINDLQQMINQHSVVHKALKGNLSGLSWYQRWLGFAFKPTNLYQYFEKYIFPLIEYAPIYNGLADQGVELLAITYVKAIEKQIETIKANKQFDYNSKTFTDALQALASAFTIYSEFLSKNKNLLPIGSYKTFASSYLVRNILFGITSLGTGTATAKKLGLDPQKILAEKKEITEAFSRSVPLKAKILAGGEVIKHGVQSGTEYLKKSFEPSSVEKLTISEKVKTGWQAVKQSAKTSMGAIKAKTAQLSGGYIGGTKGLEDISKTSQYTYTQAKHAIYGKVLATAVATYLGYKTVQWLLKDWPRQKFTPSGRAS